MEEMHTDSIQFVRAAFGKTLLATFAMAACAGADSFRYPSRLTPRDRSGS